MNKDEIDDERGIPAARANLMVANRAMLEYLAERTKGRSADKHALMLYYGAFFFFARSALYALEKSDGRVSPGLNGVQVEYFRTHIADHPIFALLKGERDRVGHGDESWALHPMLPLGMIRRFNDAGHDWSVAVFDDTWPDGEFKGRRAEEVLPAIWRQVSNWLDDIDVLDGKRLASP